MHVNCVLFSSVHYILLLFTRMQCHLLQMQWPHVTGCLLGCGIVEANFGSRSEQSENNTTVSSFLVGSLLVFTLRARRCERGCCLWECRPSRRSFAMFCRAGLGEPRACQDYAECPRQNCQ